METGENLPEDLQKAFAQFNPNGRLDYGYQKGLPTSVALNETDLLQIEYDELGRVKSQLNAGEGGNNHSIEYRELGNGNTDMIDTATGTRTRYDRRMRPVLQVKKDGSLWELSYPEDGGASVRIRRPGGEVIRVTEDKDRRNYSLVSTTGEKLEVSKRPDGGEVFIKRNGQLERARAAFGGTPTEYTNADQHVQFEYDDGGGLRRIVQTPAGKKETEIGGDWIETSVDRLNRPSSIQTGYGDKLQLAFDNQGRPTQIVDNQRVVEIKRNPDGNLMQVRTNWGEAETCEYDSQGGLTKYSINRDGGQFTVTITRPLTPKENGRKSIDMLDYRKNRTRLEVNDKEQSISIFHPDKTETRVQVNNETHEVLVEDGLSQTRSTYDSRGNLVKLSQKAISK